MQNFKVSFCLMASLLVARLASAVVVGPYTADSSTVFLFHLDEPANSLVATNASGSTAAGTNAVSFKQPSNTTAASPTDSTVLNGTAGASGFHFGNFGSCAAITNGGALTATTGTISNGLGADFTRDGAFEFSGSASTGDILANSSLILGANNSLTVEALINVAVTNTAAGTGREIVCSDSGGTRSFQFRLNGPNIELNTQPGVNASANDLLIPIPTTGSHAWVANQWYHIAWVHSEVGGNATNVFYWTSLSDSFATANAIATNTTATFNSAATLMVVIGNKGRTGGSGSATEGFRGFIDEVRISKTARTAAQMMFSDGTITISQQPLNATVAAGGTATFTLTATSPISSWAPLSYQWYSNSVALANGGDFSGVNTNKLVVANVQAAYATTYYCVITNQYNTNTSATVSLSIHNPLNLAWRGTVNSNWDNAAATNWFDTGSGNNTNFFASDNVTFDNTGTGNPVLITNTVQPGSVTVSASAVNYVFTGGGKITGTTGLTKTNSGALTIQTTNDYTGVTYLGGGTVSVASVASGLAASPLGASSSASTNLVLDGADLQYTGGTATIDRGATLNAGGGTIEVTNPASTLALNGVIAGTAGGGFTKLGTGTLSLGGANTWNGATTIGAGTVQLTGSGSFGAGNVTNNGTIISSGVITITNNLSGSGSISNDATGTLTLSGANSYTGSTFINGPNNGGLVVASSSALGSTPLVSLTSTTGGANGGTRVTLNAGVTTPVGATLSLPTASTTVRSILLAAGGTGTWSGPINIVGDNAANPGDQLAFAGAGGFLVIGGNVTSSSFAGGTLQLRGDGSAGGGTGGAVNGTISISTSTLQVNDGVMWTINSTGNTWGLTQIAHGTLQLGANNALPAATTVQFGAAGNSALDLNGFTQQVAALTVSGSINFITNSSATADAALVFSNTASPSTFSANIQDGFGGGGRKLALTVAGGTLTLSGTNTYNGNTTISAGTLALSGSGWISNSASITVAGGATLDVSALSSAPTLGAAQALTGGGATGTVAGSVSVGSGSLALNYTNGTPTLRVTNGTVTLNNNAVTVTVAGSTPLTGGSYKLVSAATGGSVAGSVSSSVLTVNGAGTATPAKLQIIAAELYLVVDHPPVAAPLTVSRNAGLSFKLALTDLATNWTDADGDGISFVSVSNSTNGVTVTTNGGYILYPNAANVNDQFNYTIADAQGATAGGVVNLLINTNITGQINSFSVTGGTASMTFAGIPGYTYNVQRSTDLSFWTIILTTNAPAGGLFQFTDSSAPQPAAYYRLSWTP